MNSMNNKEDAMKLTLYMVLIDNYLLGKIGVSDFEKEYLKMFKEDQTLWDGEEFDILNGLFVDIDAFCYDPTIRTSDDLDEAQLRLRAAEAATRLKALNS